MNLSKIRHSQGFTLIELLGVIGIMGVTLAFGLPVFKSTIASNRLTASVNDMVVALQLARSESIKQVKIAGVSIPSGGGSSWYTFMEVSGVPANILQNYTAATNVRVAAISNGGSDETPTYRSDGRLNSNADIQFRFTIAGGTEQRILTIAPSGRVNVTDPDHP